MTLSNIERWSAASRKGWRVRKRMAAATPRPPAPCAICHAASRQSGDSYCRRCRRAYNREWYRDNRGRSNQNGKPLPVVRVDCLGNPSTVDLPFLPPPG